MKLWNYTNKQQRRGTLAKEKINKNFHNNNQSNYKNKLQLQHINFRKNNI